MISSAEQSELERLTRFAAEHPRAYERRVLLLAIAGYAYLVGAIALVIALMVGLGFVVLWWHGQGHPSGIFAIVWIGLIIVLFSLVHSFTITPPAPRGLRLVRDDAPKLFDLIEEVRQRARVPHVDEVLLSPEQFAASEVRMRLGLFGPARRYLVVGMPALLAVTTDELRAVLAHELGHLAAIGGRHHAWVYGVRESWLRLLRTLDGRRTWTAVPFALVFGWYMARFGRYSFVLARQLEIKADETAAAICGPELVAASLMRLGSLASLQRRAVFPRLGMAPAGHDGPTGLTRDLLRRGRTESDLRRDMNAALAQDDGVADVHLSLGARLASLTTAPTPVPDPTWSAADEIFGASVDIWCARADALWRDLRAPRSPEAETAAKTMELELAHLESRRMAELDVASLRQLAELTEALRGAPAARAVYEELAARDDAIGHLGVGRMLLRDGDRRGLASLERAVELDRAAAGAAYALSHEFFSGMDQPSEAREYEQRFLAAYETAVADEGLRTALEPSDELVGHELDGDAARAFAEMLSRVRPVARAYLVRKIVPGRPDLDAHFLAIVYGKMWFLSTEAEKIAELSARVAQAAAELKPDITVVVVNRYAGRSKIEAVPGALIYRRAPESLGRQVVPRWARRIQNGIFVLSVCYALMYVYFVANIRPEFNAIAGPIVLAPIFAVVALLFWARRADDMSRRLAGLAGVSALMGVLVGAFLTEQEWTFVFVPALALGLLRPPAEAGSRRTAAVIAAAFVGALSVRILAHLVLIG